SSSNGSSTSASGCSSPNDSLHSDSSLLVHEVSTFLIFCLFKGQNLLVEFTSRGVHWYATGG
ncbi:unnamed protein product, partial [Tetraodon nigroviridis]